MRQTKVLDYFVTTDGACSNWMHLTGEYNRKGRYGRNRFTENDIGIERRGTSVTATRQAVQCSTSLVGRMVVVYGRSIVG
jgi:hypothetical protein